MSDITVTKVIQSNSIPVEYNKGNWNLFDNKKFYYKQEAEITGGPGNYSWKIDVIRSSKSNFSDGGTVIGYRDISSGALILTNPNNTEDANIAGLENSLKIVQNDINVKINNEIKLNNNEQKKLDKSTNTLITTEENITDLENEIIGAAAAATDIKLEDAITTGNQTLSSISIEGRRFRESYGNYSYPEDLKSNKQDRIRFSQSYSEGTKLQADLINPKTFQRRIKKITGSVTLPIVTGIQDENSVDWKGATLNPIQALAGAGALGIFESVRKSGDIDDAFSQGAAAVGNVRNQLINNKQVGSDIASAINVYLAQQAVGAQGLLSRTTGAILNPNLEMLFGGPQVRRFTFSFTLSPRDADEADQVRKILRFFKQGMSVKTSSSNVFLKAPNIFDIQYQTFNTQGQEIVHPSINIIKTCALTSCNVRYTPNGTYMTYDDPYRTMAAYQLTLAFNELDPIYDSDYSELDKDRDQVIGY